MLLFSQPPDILRSGYVIEKVIITESSQQYFATNQFCLDGANFDKIFSSTAFNTTLYSNNRRRECYKNSLLICSELPMLMGEDPAVVEDLLKELEKTASDLSKGFRFAGEFKTNYIRADNLAAITRNFISRYLRKINPKSYKGVKIKTTNLEHLANALQYLKYTTIAVDVAYKATLREALASDLAFTNLLFIENTLIERRKSGINVDPVIFEAIDEVKLYLAKADEYYGALILEIQDRMDEFIPMGINAGLNYIKAHYLAGALAKFYSKTGAEMTAKAATAKGTMVAGMWTMSLWLTYETIDGILDQHQKMQTAITSATLAILLKKEIESGRITDSELLEAIIVQAEYDYYYHMVEVHSGSLPEFRDFIDNMVYGEKYNKEWKSYYESLKTEAGTYLVGFNIFDFPSPGSSSGKIILGFLLDSSGSMSQSDPLDIRKSAMKQIIDIIRDDDLVFIVDFDNEAKWINSQNWNNINKADLKNEVDKIDSNGGTAIGLGLTTIKDAIESVMTDNGRGAVLLLSDGKSTFSSETDWFSLNNFPVYSVSYKNIANAQLLNRISSETNGLYISANNEDEVVSAFMQFYNDLYHSDRFVSNHGILKKEHKVEMGFMVDANTTQIIANLSFNTGACDLKLLSPSGKDYSGNSQGNWYTGSNYYSVKIDNPEGGQWLAALTGTDGLPAEGTPYRFEVSGSTPNHLILYENKSQTGSLEYNIIDPDGINDIKDLHPKVNVTTPKNIKIDISGNYINGNFRFIPRHGPGNYKFDVELVASDKSGEKYQRFMSRTAFVGDNYPSFIAEIKSVTGGMVKTDIGYSSGNQPGIKCLIYSTVNGNRVKIAEGYVTYVTKDDCQIEIQQYYGKGSISGNDIVELDYYQWQGDKLKK